MEQDCNDIPEHEYVRLVKSLRDLGLVHSAKPRIVALTGGVSSLIVRVDDKGGSFCAKSALPKLKVEADWQVPVHRNQAEVAWMRKAAVIAPSAVPDILGDDADQNIFAMQWLEPNQYPVWKQQLMNGTVSVPFASEVGRVLGEIHAGTANSPNLETEFSNAADFDALRLDPYLRATTLVCPEVAEHLLRLCDVTAQSCFVLIHGDVSPKNILAGSEGPIFLDAECATYGDPAFDLAFCLNHLILKVAHFPDNTSALVDSFLAMTKSYLSHVNWEPVSELEARTAALLPALALARVHGKSPVEYLTDAEKLWVGHNAVAMIKTPAIQLDEFINNWRNNLK